MISVALKGLAKRKLRALLTALAIVLGVAMVSGTYVLTDTIKSAFDQIFAGSYKNTAAVITGKSTVSFAQSGSPTVPNAVLDRVKGLDGVRDGDGPDLQPERQLRPGQADRPRRQAARHERQPDVRVRPRPRHRQAQPDDAHARPLGRRARARS